MSAPRGKPGEPGNLNGGALSVRFPRGQSGNPNGRPSIGKALKANGTTTTEVLAKLCKIALDALDDPKVSERSREYAHDWLSKYILGRPKESLDVDVAVGMVRERIASMDVGELEARISEKRASLEVLTARRLLEEPAGSDEEH